MSITNKIHRFQAVLGVLNPEYTQQDFKSLVQKPYDFDNEAIEYIDRVRMAKREGLEDQQARVRAINEMYQRHEIKIRGLL